MKVNKNEKWNLFEKGKNLKAHFKDRSLSFMAMVMALEYIYRIKSAVFFFFFFFFLIQTYLQNKVRCFFFFFFFVIFFFF